MTVDSKLKLSSDLTNPNAFENDNSEQGKLQKAFAWKTFLTTFNETLEKSDLTIWIWSDTLSI